MDKLVITVSVTGSLTTREQNPNIPYTPEEIAASTLESYQAGASVVHLHVREPVTGRPVQDTDLFKKTIFLIRRECDILINTSTGGGPGMTFDERIAIIPELSSDKQVKPELASLNAGSLNYGIFSRSKRAFVLDAIQENPWSELLRFADIMKENQVKPEIEIYDVGMINNSLFLQEAGALETPLHFQFVLGVLGGMQPTVENLSFLKTSIPSNATWSLCAVGLDIFNIGPVAIASGGHVRVGLEDSVYVSRGKLASSNAQMVAKINRIATEMGRDIATPHEARKILKLKE